MFCVCALYLDGIDQALSSEKGFKCAKQWLVSFERLARKHLRRTELDCSGEMTAFTKNALLVSVGNFVMRIRILIL